MITKMKATDRRRGAEEFVRAHFTDQELVRMPRQTRMSAGARWPSMVEGIARRLDCAPKDAAIALVACLNILRDLAR